MAQNTGDNRHGPTTWIVAPSLANGSHSTITSACASASAGDTIAIRPGSYTEDFTIPAGVELVGFGNGSTSAVDIVGKITMTATGVSSIKGIRLQTNSDYAVEITGSNSTVLHIIDCTLQCTNSSGLHCTNTTGSMRLWQCSISTANAIGIHVTTGGTIFYFNCNGTTSGTAAVSTCSAGSINFQSSNFNQPFSTSGTGSINSWFTRFSNAATTCIALAGTGQSTLLSNHFGSTTAAAVTVGAGHTCLFDDNVVNSTNAAPISGAGAIVYGKVTYSNTGSANTVTTRTAYGIDTGFVTFDGGTTRVNNNLRYQGPYYENLGITYSGGTFTVRGATATLSATNPAYVVLPSKATPGAFTRYAITADQNFIDDAGASEIINNLFGLTTSVAYAQDLPFFLYAVTNDAESAIQFMISRVPDLRQSPATANIGAPDDAVADTQGSFFSLDNIDETLYDTNPCLMVGSFRMRMSASDDWTVQTLDDQDGIGQFQYSREFTFPTAAFGAATGTYIQDNGGTAPVFSTNEYLFRILPGSRCEIQYFMDGDGGTDGAGAVVSFLTIPYIAVQNGNNFYAGAAYWNSTSITARVGGHAISAQNLTSWRGETGDILTNDEMPSGSRNIYGTLQYKMSDS